MIWQRLLFTTFVIVLLLGLPFWADDYLQRMVARALVFGLLALSLDILVGHGGLISMGHAAPFGIGAYVSAVLSANQLTSFPLMLSICALTGLILGVAVGTIALRARGLAFIFLTLATAEIVYFVVRGLRVLGGFDGMPMTPRAVIPLIGSLRPASTMLMTTIVASALTLAMLYWLSRTYLYQRVRAIKEEERRALALGLDPFGHRLGLFALSYAIATCAGSLYANLSGFVSPGLLSWQSSGEILAMVLLGGSGGLLGPFVGGAIFVSLQTGLSMLTEYWHFWLGLIVLARVMIGRSATSGLGRGLWRRFVPAGGRGNGIRP